MSHLFVERLSPAAKLPTRATTGAAGYDIFSSEETHVPAASRRVVKTDIKVAIPAGHYGRIAPRSGLAVKKGIDIAAGVIDSDYRGPLGVVVVNNGAEQFDVAVGDRIAQLIIEKISTPEVVQVVSLDDTARGSGGFGSTGA
jgi:dUTP pyrophosphatase